MALVAEPQGLGFCVSSGTTMRRIVENKRRHLDMIVKNNVGAPSWRSFMEVTVLQDTRRFSLNRFLGRLQYMYLLMT